MVNFCFSALLTNTLTHNHTVITQNRPRQDWKYKFHLCFPSYHSKCIRQLSKDSMSLKVQKVWHIPTDNNLPAEGCL